MTCGRAQASPRDPDACMKKRRIVRRTFRTAGWAAKIAAGAASGARRTGPCVHRSATSSAAAALPVPVLFTCG